jgi:hypothetical protein
MITTTGSLAAQSGTVYEGALDLLTPTGARAVGMGQAAVADAQGTDAAWWNPALLGLATKREISFDFSQSLFAASDNTLSLVLPASQIGTLALAVRYIDYGEQVATAATDTSGTGLISTSTLITSASFGSVIGGVAVGLTFKYYRAGFACSGECPALPVSSATTSAVDFGGQYALHVASQPVSLAIAVRNVGPRLQYNDAPQADPLPGRIDAGFSTDPRFSSMPTDLSLELAGDVVTRLSGGGGPGYRAGGELGWQKRYSLRLGYVLYGPTGSGASLGVGFTTGKLGIDLARFVSDLTVQAGQPPTYLSLHYTF